MINQRRLRKLVLIVMAIIAYFTIIFTLFPIVEALFITAIIVIGVGCVVLVGMLLYWVVLSVKDWLTEPDWEEIEEIRGI